MLNVILKVAFPYRDERLYPPGWRSFSNEYYCINSIELTQEIISVNAVEEPHTAEITLVNDLAYTIEEVICVVQLEITNEIVCSNYIAEETTKEIILVNDLAYTITEVICIVQLEITNEIISLSKIDDEQTTEITLVNDLAYTITEVICVVQLEITNEIISMNYIADKITKEVIGINYLSAEKINEIYCINDIENTEIAIKEIICLNSLRDAVSFERYSHTINFFLDDSLITGYIKNWSINISEDSYIHKMDINFVNSILFSQCDPSTNIGTRRIKFVIDSIEFQFLLEKRNVNRTSSIGEFGIWGRSLISILDLPYAVPIIDKDIVQDIDTGEWSCPDDDNYIPHIWQTGDRLASEIMDVVIKAPFSSVDFSLDFRINDYLVRQGALSVSNSSPIKIVNKLAGAKGGRVRTDLLDKVIIKPYKFDELGTEVATYTDTENILQLDESLSFPEGYNKILVKGWEDPLEEGSIGLKIELDLELNDEDTTFYFGEEIWIRIYVSPFNLEYLTPTCSLGILHEITLAEITTITEEKAVFIGASMQLSYPINSITEIRRYDCSYMSSSQYSYKQGYDFVTSEDSDIQDEPVVITYTTRSDLYKLIVDQPCDPLPWSEVLSRITVKQT